MIQYTHTHCFTTWAAIQETAAEEAMDEARRVGQAVPKYTTQANAAVARASRLGGEVVMGPFWLGNSQENHGNMWLTIAFTWFFIVI